MLSFSTNSLLAIGALLLTGCAGSAPPLPANVKPPALAEFSANDANLTCEQIGAERARIHQQMAADNSHIDENRTRNQVATYAALVSTIGLLALPVTEGNSAEKKDLKQLYDRQDLLIRLAAAKACPAVPN